MSKKILLKILAYHNREIKAYSTMPYSEQYPFPEHFIVELFAELTTFVNLWVFERVMVINILFQN